VGLAAIVAFAAAVSQVTGFNIRSLIEQSQKVEPVSLDQRPSLAINEISPLQFDRLDVRARVSAINDTPFRIEPGALVQFGINLRPWRPNSNPGDYAYLPMDDSIMFPDHFRKAIATLGNATPPHSDITADVKSDFANDFSFFGDTDRLGAGSVVVFVTMDARFDDRYGSLRSQSCYYYVPPRYDERFICAAHNNTWSVKR